MSHPTEQGLTCMIEGCNAMGEEVIALLSGEGSLSDYMNEYDEHHNDYGVNPSQGSNLKNNDIDNDNINNNNLIPAVVCGKHFGKLVEACYLKVT
jgi:hypothetical protein